MELAGLDRQPSGCDPTLTYSAFAPRSGDSFCDPTDAFGCRLQWLHYFPDLIEIADHRFHSHLKRSEAERILDRELQKPPILGDKVALA